MARQGGGAGLCARRSDVCIKSGIVPVVGEGLETGCSGYQERVAQNRQWLVGAATGSRTVPKSGWPRTPTLYTTDIY